MRHGLTALLFGAALAGAPAAAQEPFGTWQIATPGGAVVLVLARGAGDEVHGTLSGNGSSGTIRARLEKDLVVGTIAFGPQSLCLRAYAEGAGLRLDLAEADAAGAPVWSAGRSLLFEAAAEGAAPSGARNPFARGATPATADPLAGRWSGEGVVLALTGGNGRWTGELSFDGAAFPVEMEGGPAGARGVLVEAGQRFPFQARLDGDTLVLDSGQGSFRLVRGDGREGGAGPAGPTRRVTVNGVRLSDDTLAALERGSQVRIGDGDYWYDRGCGAWGVIGGPMLGAIPAGLDLGGPLAANASGGGTGVFINGRELHPYDVLALQRLGSVPQGRYWVDGFGNGGYEGSPATFNLVEAARRAGGGGGPWSHHTKYGDAHVGGDGLGFSYYIDKDVSWSSGG